MEENIMKKVLCLVMAALMAAFCFASCGSSSSSASGTTGGKLTVATNAEFPPFESLDENNNVVGFDADIIKAVAEKIGMTVEFKNMEFDGVVAAVSSGNCDVAASGLTINAKRSKAVDFSTPYYEGAAQILIVRTNDNVFTGTTKADLDNQLKGKKIGVCTGFTGVSYANGDEEWGFTKIENATVKTYENISLAITDLKSGTIDTIIMDDKAAKEAAATDNNKNDVKVIDVPLTVESYGIAVQKGNTELKEKIDNALAELKKEGKIDELVKKWNV